MITSLIYLAITIIVVGLVLWLLIYLIDTVPMPEQFRGVARVVIIAIGIIILLFILLNFIGVLPGGSAHLLR